MPPLQDEVLSLPAWLVHRFLETRPSYDAKMPTHCAVDQHLAWLMSVLDVFERAKTVRVLLPLRASC